MSLHLGKGLDLPVSFATEGVVAIGMRGSGKSNTLVRWAELLYDASIPFCAVDPKGDWGGIRSSADGKKPGLSVPLFGGLDGDFPLDEKLGGRIADLLVDTGLSAVLDVSRLSLAARMRFLADFFDGLMDRHQRERHVRCVIFEEAHRYIPQTVPASIARLKEAAASILLEGRSFGLGCWAATQRPARLHNDVLEEVGTAVIHRIGVAATNDLKRIAGWVKHEELSDEIVPSLNRLADGEAWVVAPSTLGVATRVQIDRRRTFDSAATPIVGAGSHPIVTLADVDVAAIKEALAEAIERAKADDPRELRRRIADLERQLRDRPQAQPVVEEVVSPGLLAGLTSIECILSDLAVPARTIETRLAESATTVRGLIIEAKGIPTRGQVGAPRPFVPAITEPVPARRTRPAEAPTGGKPLKAGARRMLAALAALHPVRLSRAQLGTRADVRWTGGTFGDYLSTLRTSGYVDEDDAGVGITAAGFEAIGGAPDAPATTEELLAVWRRKLKAGARRMLDVLVENYPAQVSRADLGALADVSPDGGTFGDYLSLLKRPGLADVDGQMVRASESLFLG